MKPTLKIDDKQFQRALREYQAATKKDAATVLNDKAFFICRRATWTTGMADRAKVQQELGAVGQQVRQITRGKNKGKFRGGAFIVDKSSLAERIVRARLYAKGEEQPTQAHVGALASRFIKSRMSSIGFIKSGWAYAANVAARFTKKGGGGKHPDSRPKVKRAIGGAVAAMPGWHPVATFYNAATSIFGDNQRDALNETAGEGLRVSIAEEMRDMVAYTAKKLQETANKFKA